MLRCSGVGEIRTHEGLSPLAVFKTAALNHSATTPGAGKLRAPNIVQQGEAGRLRCA
jgi:hypothetical protein